MLISRTLVAGSAIGVMALLAVVVGSFGAKGQQGAQPGAPSGETLADTANRAVQAAMAARAAVLEALPPGAVMAFNLPSCPIGWSAFAPLSGRVILGAGAGGRDVNDRPLSERKLGDLGGEEKHVLTVAELAKHNHVAADGRFRYLMMSDSNGTANQTDQTSGQPNLEHVAEIASAGGDQGHNIVQPFYVLTYCQRQ